MLLYDDHDATGDRKGVVSAVAFSPDGSVVASAGKDGSLFLRDAAGRRLAIVDREPNTLAIHSVVFADDGSLMVGGAFGWHGYRQGGAGEWQVFGLLRATPTNALAVLDEHTLAVGTGDRDKATLGAFELWDLAGGSRRKPHFPEPNGVRAVAACPARRLVAWATGHRKVCVWDIRKQKPVEMPQPKPCPALALSPDGSHLAAAVDWGVKVFAIEKGYERFELKHKGGVHAIAYSPDGSTIATGSWDETVKLWDAGTGRERATFQWPIGRVCCLTYAPDGLRLAAGGDKGALVVWDME
jgi:WD40 repeat protein